MKSINRKTIPAKERTSLSGSVIILSGRVTEWFKEPVLKTGVGQPTEGSNPSPSAKNLWLITY